MSAQKRMKLDRLVSPCTKTSFKWIEDLSAKPDAVKPLEVIDSTLPDTGVDSLSRTPFTQKLRPTIDKQDLIKLKKTPFYIYEIKVK